MSLLFMISVGFSLSSLSMMVIQPLSLGLMLMLMVLCVSGLTSLIIFSWYGYLLFLVYVGGMLVMFMYVISLIPNLIFLSNKVFAYFFFIFFGFMMMNFFVMKELVSVEVKSMSLFDYGYMSMGGSGIIMLYDNFFCYVLLAVILLFVLISVVKICYYCEGPLRVFKFK
uniref:NADH-ubiquinone oxidoreductase chain 6 n=1 Tax=Heterololigo bleekeri TaxID=1423826 RepID=NU6M_HETBL|nr:NADH dehydrogenase subunit 6 [Heterololigo bleekeri]O47478.1 RecName: Full=NADH-ubiquinone oxidoreductase chain 6; AltName: Full=NADH dehydrogenase subunit 6 [Heterololigo bleekeri]BAA24061.1 NADH dehydrogenase 6 [Heterololigo bleekeri]BAB03648.1 NADH dehydrogenase subunit 6 [Heterololigo bleekeri]